MSSRRSYLPNVRWLKVPASFVGRRTGGIRAQPAAQHGTVLLEQARDNGLHYPSVPSLSVLCHLRDTHLVDFQSSLSRTREAGRCPLYSRVLFPSSPSLLQRP